MHWHFSALVLGLLIAGAAGAAPADALALTQQVDQLFGAYTEPGSPGCAVGVIRDGETVYMQGYGLANVEHGIAIDPSRTVFDLGSTSKQFTAAAIMLLVSDGKLTLDDKVRTHLPEMPDYARKITIRDLLHHTSGLRDFTVLMTMGTGVREMDYSSADEAMALITRQKALNFQPGTHFMYSNTNYFLLARIVERISGQTFSKFMEQRIFMPLGMTQTRIGEHADAVVLHQANAYQRGADGRLVLVMQNWEHIGASRVLSTVTDLAKWDRNFYLPKVGGQGMIEELQRKGIRSDGIVLKYASGLMVDALDGQPVLRHRGNTGGYSGDLVRLPQTKLSVVLLCNNSNSDIDVLTSKVIRLYLGDQIKTVRPMPAPVPAAPVAAVRHADVQRLVGTFVERYNQNIRRIEEIDGKLWYVRSERSRSELGALGNDRFKVEGSAAQAQFLAAGHQLRFIPDDGEPAEFDKVDPALPTADHFADYAGTYVSDEIGVRWTIVVKDGALTRQAAREPDRLMTPLFADAFHADTEQLRFTRDRGGRITGFSANNIRVLGVRFVKLAE